MLTPSHVKSRQRPAQSYWHRKRHERRRDNHVRMLVPAYLPMHSIWALLGSKTTTSTTTTTASLTTHAGFTACCQPCICPAGAHSTWGADAFKFISTTGTNSLPWNPSSMPNGIKLVLLHFMHLFYFLIYLPALPHIPDSLTAVLHGLIQQNCTATSNPPPRPIRLLIVLLAGLAPPARRCLLFVVFPVALQHQCLRAAWT